MKKGIKMFGNLGIEAVLSEQRQLHNIEVMVLVLANGLRKGEKRDVLLYLMFLKQKRCGKIKGQCCADRRKQRIYTTKKEASSPTVSIESLMISCTIDAKKAEM
jgi:hypothetical protein